MTRHPGLLLLAAAVAASVLAGCGSTRTVHVTDPRPTIRDNKATVGQVRANFAGKPAETGELPGGWRCASYGSTQTTIDATDGRPAWVVKICYRLPAE